MKILRRRIEVSVNLDSTVEIEPLRHGPHKENHLLETILFQAFTFRVKRSLLDFFLCVLGASVV